MKITQQMKDLAGFLEKADAFFCFIRSWWDGAGIDAALWWKDSTGCHRRVIKTGETAEPKPPLSDKQTEISGDQLAHLLEEVERAGLTAIAQLPRPIVIGSQSDDRLGLKTGPHQPAHWLDIAGSVHDDPRQGRVLEVVFSLVPQLCSDE